MITNYLSPLEFRVAVKRLPNIEFFVQRTSVPSVSASPVEMPTPFNRTFQTPDKLTYGNLDLAFIVDEKMENYLEIYNWLNDMTSPRNFNEFKRIKESTEGLMSDISIQLLNSHKRPTLELQFVNCFPVSISDLILDTTQTDVVYPEVTASFQYDSFSIIQFN